MSFNNLNLIPSLLKAIKQEGYTKPTPIQAEAIPAILDNKDILGCAQTGTGKTAAFSIPLLQMLFERELKKQKNKPVLGLIITPTRELAIQIGESIEAYGIFTGLHHTVIYGGVSQNPQVIKLKKGVDIIVATPGRLLDLMNQGFVKLDQIKYFVLDEADRMLDMGFIHDINRIIAKLPAKRQTLFFSATMPREIEKLAGKILTDPVKIAVTPVSSTVDVIEQSLYNVAKEDKKRLLIHLLKDNFIKSILVFSRTKHGANRIAGDLAKKGIKVAAIHGNKSQTARQKALKEFKEKRIRVLVATDIAARGIDVDELSHVVNYDLPEVPETYIHRIGRTGRAGLSGAAISFCSEYERKNLKEIEKLIDQPIHVVKDHPFVMTQTSYDYESKREPNIKKNYYRSFNKMKNTDKKKYFIKKVITVTS
ncbi:MAG: DEAD/DEAH box helicase [Spirochaetes bacterium]|nr:DEAD/DEAH box helicase [Spirochaetota bacterium]